ncbi:MAG: hypothetical protein R3E12_15565 [Candidatus Eisenbacteria bacterium]|uniref:Uncharacterized protein n=1 Tax=Eiseniibacteriota bacterium TaxID=2212470 RepID=A0A956RP27_UNCEI|nr:hypothetical protein [Candidatus Eisenbacteria bacterium]
MALLEVRTSAIESDASTGYDGVSKPFKTREIAEVVLRAIDHARHRRAA